MGTYGSSANYTRRYNDAEGTVDSICSHCHRTVASARDEKRLSLLEEIHLCIPKLIAADQLVVAAGLPDAGERSYVL